MSTLPTHNQIQDYLGNDFFPQCKDSIYLVDIIAAVISHFNVSPEDANIPSHGHGTTGTSLECRVAFSLVDLRTQGVATLIGDNYWKAGNSKYLGRIIKQSVKDSIPSLRILKNLGQSKEDAIQMLSSKWNEASLAVAAQLVYS